MSVCLFKSVSSCGMSLGVCLSVCPIVCFSSCLCLFLRVSVYIRVSVWLPMSVSVCVHISVRLSVYMPYFSSSLSLCTNSRKSICLYFYLCLFVYIRIHGCFYLHTCLSICLLASLFPSFPPLRTTFRVRLSVFLSPSVCVYICMHGRCSISVCECLQSRSHAVESVTRCCVPGLACEPCACHKLVGAWRGRGGGGKGTWEIRCCR